MKVAGLLLEDVLIAVRASRSLVARYRKSELARMRGAAYANAQRLHSGRLNILSTTDRSGPLVGGAVPSVLAGSL